MAYAQATMTSVNAANDFVTVLDGLLTTAGWTDIETLTPSGNYRNRTYKSPGTTNLCGYDWYLSVCWTTIGTENYVEVWSGRSYAAGILTGMSGGDHTYAPTPGTTLTTQPVSGDYLRDPLNMNTHIVTSAMTYNFKTIGTGVTQTRPGFQTLVPSSAFAYWMSVTLDHVALFTTVSANKQNAVYSTLVLDSDYAASPLYNHTPVICWNDPDFTMSSSLIGVSVVSSPTQFRAVHASFSGEFGARLPALSDEYYPAYAWAPHVYLDYMDGGPGAPTTYKFTALSGGVHVGYTPDIYLVYGGSMGDTVTIDGATYVLTGPMVNFPSVQSRPTVAVLVE